MQRSPNCDMVLVHDDDLARIARFRNSDATHASDDTDNTTLNFVILIFTTTGNPPTRH